MPVTGTTGSRWRAAGSTLRRRGHCARRSTVGNGRCGDRRPVSVSATTGDASRDIRTAEPRSRRGAGARYADQHVTRHRSPPASFPEHPVGSSVSLPERDGTGRHRSTPVPVVADHRQARSPLRRTAVAAPGLMSFTTCRARALVRAPVHIRRPTLAAVPRKACCDRRGEPLVGASRCPDRRPPPRLDSTSSGNPPSGYGLPTSRAALPL
jgi:hypothetical protein